MFDFFIKDIGFIFILTAVIMLADMQILQLVDNLVLAKLKLVDLGIFCLCNSVNKFCLKFIYAQLQRIKIAVNRLKISR